MSDDHATQKLLVARDAHRRAYDSLHLTAMRNDYAMTLERCYEIRASLEAIRDSIIDKTIPAAHANCDVYLQQLDDMHREVVWHLVENKRLLAPAPPRVPAPPMSPTLEIDLDPAELVFHEAAAPPEVGSTDQAVTIDHQPHKGVTADTSSNMAIGVRIDLSGVDIYVDLSRPCFGAG